MAAAAEKAGAYEATVTVRERPLRFPPVVCQKWEHRTRDKTESRVEEKRVFLYEV